MPHKRNRGNGRIVAMAAADAIKLTLVEPPKGTWIQRLFVPHPRQLIEISWSAGKARIVTPAPAEAATKIRRCLDTSRPTSG
jgi:hypothetical protein